MRPSSGSVTRSPFPFPAYILAGGQSSRFGEQDKALAEIDSSPLISRLADQLSRQTNRVTVIADRVDKYAALGLRTLADLHPGCGPLAGLECALADATTTQAVADDCPWILLASCDLTVLKSNWISTLWDSSSNSGARIVTFRDDDGQRHPMPGLYHRAISPAVTELVQSNRRSLHRLIEEFPHLDIACPADWPEVAQINTQADLDRFKASQSNNINNEMQNKGGE